MNSSPRSRSLLHDSSDLGGVLDSGAALDRIPTPAVVVDVRRMEANLREYIGALATTPVVFRPHIKAHKSVAIYRRQMAAGAEGITAAKVSEAAVFASAGCDDIVIANSIVAAEKCARIAVMARTARVAVNVENELGARELSRAATSHGVRIGCQLEIDSGLERTGLPSHDLSAIVKLGELIEALPGLDLEGITTYRGRALPEDPFASNEEAGADEARLMIGLAESLRQRRLPVARVTLGSTATSRAAAQVSGVTEVRAGAYLFNDGAQVANGSATDDRVALTIVVTVVSSRKPGWVTVDGGSKTFGAASPASGCAVEHQRRGVVMRTNEEHGLVKLSPGFVPSVGEQLRFIPIHASGVVGLTDCLVAIDEERVVDIWKVDARGKTT